jgi:hypothetical protein
VGGTRTTFASGFTGTDVCPAFDSSGDLFVGDGDKLEEYVNGAWTTFASGFTGTVVCPASNSNGNLFVGDGDKIEEYVGGAWTTFASGFTGSVVCPAFDSSGHLFVGEDAKIEEYVGGAWTTYMSGFTGTIVCPTFDNSGNLWVGNNASLYEYVGGVRTTFASGFTGTVVCPAFAPPPPPATVALSGAVNATIITGGTGTLGATVSNSAGSGANDLNYTLSATVQSGGATLGAITPGAGTLAPGASQPCTLPATSSNLGVNTISLTASDPNSSNSSQTTAATLTVLDHSNASLSSTATQTSQTIDFGSVLAGASIPSQSFTIDNRAAHTSAAYTANLKLTGFSASGDPALTTNLSTFSGLAAGNGETFTASLNTANNTTTGTKTVTMSASQLADDSGLPGAGGNNSGGLTVTLEANVGNATADASNSQTAFGTALTAPVARDASCANLESTVVATTGSGGSGKIGSRATILAGTNSSAGPQVVGMAWRTQTQAERKILVPISDVVDLTGLALSGSAGQTDAFVLEMTYDPELLPFGAGSQGQWAADGLIYLAYLDPATDRWMKAIDGDFGANLGSFRPGAWPAGDMTLGDWGVNTANGTVWAVVNHAGGFAAAVPLLGDANLDGIVDVNDLTIVLANFGKTGTTWGQGDFIGDGTVDVNDLTIVLSNFGETAAAALAAVPEPSGLVLLAICTSALLLFRRSVLPRHL